MIRSIFLFFYNPVMITDLLLVLVLICRFVLRKKSKRLFCVVWAMLLIRLLLPVSVQTEYSVIPTLTSVWGDGGEAPSASMGSYYQGNVEDGQTGSLAEGKAGGGQSVGFASETTGDGQIGSFTEGTARDGETGSFVSENAGETQTDDFVNGHADGGQGGSEANGHAGGRQGGSEANGHADAGQGGSEANEYADGGQGESEANGYTGNGQFGNYAIDNSREDQIGNFDEGNTGNIPSGSRMDRDGWLKLWETVWLAGMLVLAAYYILQHLYLRHKQQFAVKHTSEEGVEVWPDTTGACVIGLWKPVIYLPAGLDQASEDIILKHEQTHIERRDYLLILGYLVGLILHWMNPLVWLCFYLCRNDIEMACDEAALEGAGVSFRSSYAKLLLDLSTGRKSPALLFFGYGDLKKRIDRIGRRYPMKQWQKKVTIIASALLIVFSSAACGTITPAGEKEDRNSGLEENAQENAEHDGNADASEGDREQGKTDTLPINDNGENTGNGAESDVGTGTGADPEAGDSGWMDEDMHMLSSAFDTEIELVENKKMENDYFSLELPDELIGKISYGMVIRGGEYAVVFFADDMRDHGGILCSVIWEDFKRLMDLDDEMRSQEIYQIHSEMLKRTGNLQFSMFYEEYRSPYGLSMGGECGILMTNIDDSGAYCLYEPTDVECNMEDVERYGQYQTLLAEALRTGFVTKSFPYDRLTEEEAAAYMDRLEAAVQGTERQHVYISQIEQGEMSFDRVEWLTVAEDAERLKEVYPYEDGIPNGFYLYNEEGIIETLSVARDCSYWILDHENNFVPKRLAGEEEFNNVLAERVKVYNLWNITDPEEEKEILSRLPMSDPYILTIEDGQIIAVWEQYVP